MFSDELLVTARRLVELCRSGRESDGLDTLYAPDAVSAEAADMSGNGALSVGIDAIKAKHDWWNGAMEVHAQGVDGPYLHGTDRFSVIFEVDATDRKTSARMQFREVAVYHVVDGKIVREEFFYQP